MKLIAREKEFQKISDLLNLSKEHCGSVLLVSGEAGIGKSLLLDESLSHLKQDFIKVKIIQNAVTSYSLFTSVLRQILRNINIRQYDIGNLTSYLSYFLPELNKPEQKIDYGTLVEAFISAILKYSFERPVIIYFDDLQWADNASLELFPVIANRIKNEQVFILAAYGNDNIPRNHKLRWVRNELRRSKLLNEIQVEKLDRDDTAKFMQQIFNELPGKILINIIYEKTNGLPLYIEELSKALMSQNLVEKNNGVLELKEGSNISIPENLKDAVLLRLNDISENSKKLLEIASAAGYEFDINIVSSLSGVSADLDELIEKNFLYEESNGRIKFTHSLVREIIYDEISRSQKTALNKKIADYLEQKNTAPELLAEYWLKADEMIKARDAFLLSAQKSCDIHAFSDAEQSAKKALNIWPQNIEKMKKIETLFQLSHCAKLSGHLIEAGNALKEILQHSDLDNEYKLQAELHRELATIYTIQGNWIPARKNRITAAELFEKAGMPEEAAVEYIAAASRYIANLKFDDAINMCLKAYDISVKSGRFDIQARALGLEGNILSMKGNSKEGIKKVKSALSIALSNNLSETAAEVYRRLGSTLEYASDFLSSKETYLTAYKFCTNEGIKSEANLCLSCMSFVLFRTGDWKQAVDISKELISNKSNHPGTKSIGYGILGLIHTYRGEIKKAHKYLDRAYVYATKNNVPAMEIIITGAIAQLYEIEDKTSEAEEYYYKLFQLWQEIKEMHDIIISILAASTFFVNTNNKKDALKCADILASIASETGNSEALAALAFALAENEILNNNLSEAIEQFNKAKNLFEKLEVPLEIAKTNFRLGFALIKAGRGKDSVLILKNAYNVYKKLGARAYSSKVAELLSQQEFDGKEIRSSEINQAEIQGLTNRQSEILQWISKGLTNKEIAEKLFLSTRTVDMHVSHIFERLNCRTRTEAISKAKELEFI